MAYLDNTGLAEVWAKIKGYFGHALAINVGSDSIDLKLNNGESTATTLNTVTLPLAGATAGKAGLMSSAQATNLANAVTKLSGIAEGAEVNQNAFSTVKVGTTSLSADTKTDTLTITAGSNITLTPTASSDSFSIAASVPSASSTTPKMDGTAAVGTGTTWARADHVHPHDSSKADLAGATFTGAPKYASDPGDGNTLTRKSYVDTAIGNAIAGVQGISYEIVQTLPATGSAGVIYLVSNSGTAPNVYDEYIWVSNAFEKIGTTAVDLSGYWSKNELDPSDYWAKAELVAMTVAEVDAICV